MKVFYTFSNLETFEWRKPTLKSNPPPRYGHAAVLKNGLLYIYGGRNKSEIFNDLWILQIHSGVWNMVIQNGIIPSPRYGHNILNIQNHLYLFGGRTNNGTYPNELFAFDIEHYEWNRIIPVNNFGKNELIPKGRISFSSCVYNQDTFQILIIGGYCYNPETKFFTKEGDFITLDTFFNDEKKFPKIGNYKIEDYIGAGSFSTVYCVEGPKSEILALKRFRDTFGNSNILKELELIKKQNHTNLLSMDQMLLEKKEVDTYINVLMPLSELGDLFQYMTQNRQGLKEGNVLNIILQILNGLAFLHSSEAKIVHRDLKPQNILFFKKQVNHDLKINDFFKMQNDITVKLADFGITKSLDSHVVRYFTSSKTFMAPEILSDKGFSYASDMWAFGTILFFIFTGIFYDFKIEQNIQKIHFFMNNTKFKNKELYEKWIKMCIIKEPEERVTSEALFEIVKTQLETFNPKLSIKVERRPTKTGSPVIESPPPVSNLPQGSSPSQRKKGYLTGSFVFLKKSEHNYPTNNLLQTIQVMDVNSWLTAIGLEKYEQNFNTAGITTLEKLVTIEENDITEKLNILLPGHVKKIMKKAKELEKNDLKSVRIIKMTSKN